MFCKLQVYRRKFSGYLLSAIEFKIKLKKDVRLIWCIFALQADIQQLERTRESMARELVNLTNKNEELQEKIEELPMLQSKFEVHFSFKSCNSLQAGTSVFAISHQTRSSKSPEILLAVFNWPSVTCQFDISFIHF